jgi:LmbE family N-acetylglucosaminyl deacetylase
MTSLGILGVTDHRWMDYHDGACAAVGHEEGVEKVQRIIEEVRPMSVLTFGPDGMTGHTDHKAVCSWATEAFSRTAPGGARLFYATTTPEWADRFVPTMNRFNVFMEPGTPPVTPPDELAIQFALTPELLELKLEAIAAHESQVEGMMQAFGRDFFREAHATETFRLGSAG